MGYGELMLRLLWRLLFGTPCAHQWETVIDKTEESIWKYVKHAKFGSAPEMPIYKATCILALKSSLAF